NFSLQAIGYSTFEIFTFNYYSQENFLMGWDLQEFIEKFNNGKDLIVKYTKVFRNMQKEVREK
ncbi:MAG TPA: hypothetical protein PL130_08505, partial [Dictyoglomaceae bacterium]|nr:hypothetical protein [Dictyoglomaceae bacterium]